jgi:hypothetical protein
MCGIGIFDDVFYTPGQYSKRAEYAKEELPMKKIKVIAAVSMFIIAGIIASGGISEAATHEDHLEVLLEGMPVGVLTETEKSGILYLGEEEKLARDLYVAFYEKWGVRTFSQISGSEENHMDSMKLLVDRYGLVDPVLPEAGRFSDEKLQGIYDDLLAKGMVSRGEALKVAAMVEEMDIMDFREEQKKTDKPDLLAVYENLERGSRNHLRAFGRQLNKESIRYEASFLSQEEVDAIMISPNERD